jgi:hypothetical protein
MLDQKPAAALALRPASSEVKGKACRRLATLHADVAQRCLPGCMQTKMPFIVLYYDMPPHCSMSRFRTDPESEPCGRKA